MAANVSPGGQWARVEVALAVGMTKKTADNDGWFRCIWESERQCMLKHSPAALLLISAQKMPSHPSRITRDGHLPASKVL